MLVSLIEADTPGLALNQGIAGIKSTSQSNPVGPVAVLPLDARRLRFIVIAHIHPTTELPVRQFFKLLALQSPDTVFICRWRETGAGGKRCC